MPWSCSIGGSVCEVISLVRGSCGTPELCLWGPGFKSLDSGLHRAELWDSGYLFALNQDIWLFSGEEVEKGVNFA